MMRRPPAAFLILLLVWLFVATVGDLHSRSLRLEGPVSVTSSDGKTRFEADADGTLRLRDVATGRVLYTGNASPKEYYRVEATWVDNQRVRVTALWRLAAQSRGRTYAWDRQTGTVTDPWWNAVQTANTSKTP